MIKLQCNKSFRYTIKIKWIGLLMVLYILIQVQSTKLSSTVKLRNLTKKSSPLIQPPLYIILGQYVSRILS